MSNNVGDCNLSFLKGMYFNFHTGDDLITFWGSHLFGKEYVSINGERVSEKRTLSKKSTHEFVYKETNYKVVFSVRSVWFGGWTCLIYEEGVLVMSYNVEYSFNVTNRALMTIFVTLLYLAIGSIHYSLLLQVAYFLIIGIIWRVFSKDMFVCEIERS